MDCLSSLHLSQLPLPTKQPPKPDSPPSWLDLIPGLVTANGEILLQLSERQISATETKTTCDKLPTGGPKDRIRPAKPRIIGKALMQLTVYSIPWVLGRMVWVMGPSYLQHVKPGSLTPKKHSARHHL